MTTPLEEKLKTLVGEKGLKVLDEVARSTGKSIDDMVILEEIDETLGSVEVFSGVNRAPLNFKVLDKDGEEIDLDALGILDSDYGGYSVNNVYEDTVNSELLPGALGTALAGIFDAKLRLTKLGQSRENHQRKLGPIQTAMTSLGEVFGFDTYEHLEMFMAAWLMKDSTCRLSGIPGTGKTTVIESAAVLLCNSYGHSGNPRFIVPEGRVYTKDQIFGENRAYAPQTFPNGMNYAIDYSNDAYANVRDNWNKWRFTSWSPSTNGRASGAYLYETRFLMPEGTNFRNESYEKSPLSIDDYYRLLTNCYIGQVPVAGFSNPAGLEGEELLTSLPESQIQTVVVPIQLLNEKGEIVNFKNSYTYKVSDVADKDYEFELGLRFPAYNAVTTEATQNYKTILTERNKYGGYCKELKDYVVEGYGLFTDAGRSEGYEFREFLMDHFFDLRAEVISTPDGSTRYRDDKAILEEMLREIGVAKIDYEKRADEVLYGIEIRQATSDDKVRNVVKSTYEFEPVPRPIVTQPVKFFNEANRSQAGVEDAVLGLIAERKVEYRGRSFDSPSFVAWMDTNPHQKGNDLAFIDRIDMELLFKSVSLGARYDQISGKILGGGGSPQLRLVDKAITGKVAPLRFSELNSVWNFVSDGKNGIGYAPPGQTVGSSTYDALREISYISVLFTQRFSHSNNALRAAGRNDLTPSSADYLYASPLLDFSITTNTDEDGKSGVSIKRDLQESYQGHTPSDINRVLGFRFTNSLQKLSASLAFLRGKAYVTRSEILDALPYVTAHRLGRAKTSKGDKQGMSGSDLNYNNEQEWIREAIVNGYLLQTNQIGVSKGGYPLLDVWDYFYHRCLDVLRSAPNLWSYEEAVLVPLRKAMTEASAGINYTPVHWHIATMVVENEKTAQDSAGSANKPQRTYSKANDYSGNYNWYLSRVSYDPNTDKKTNEQVLFDYYALRGEICNEPNLFSDDRDTLLSLLDSKMTPICGGPSNRDQKGVANRIAVGGSNETWSGLDKKGFKNPTDKFQFRSYQDSIGAWGRMLACKGSDGAIASSSSQMEGMNYASSFSDQALMITGRIPIREITAKSLKSKGAGSLQRDRFKDQITKVRGAFIGSVLGDGVQILNIEGNKDSIKKMSFDEFMEGVSSWAENYTNKKAADFNSDETQTFGSLSGKLIGNGFMACFPLTHAAGAPLGQTPYDGEDHLRLWVRFFQSDFGGGFVTLNLTFGVTSNLTDGRGKKFIAIDDVEAYTPSNYKEKYEDGIKDTGNISMLDSLHYQMVFNNC
jgi:hypothetical protein